MSVVLVTDGEFDRTYAPDGARVETSAWLECAGGAAAGREFRLLIDCLDAERCTDAWICAQSARLRERGAAVVLSTVRGERGKHDMRVARANGYCEDDDAQFARVRLAASDRLLRASANEGWYSDLVQYVFGSQNAQKAVVLWGPPGTGKTLALERLARMRPDGDLRAALFSCNDFEDWAETSEQLCAASQRFGARSVLLIDDLDVLHAGECAATRSKLFELVATRLRCRCVLVCNDWFARENWPMRSGRLKQHFGQIRVHRVQRGALRAHLQQHYSLMRKDSGVLEPLLDEANGDVRAALIGAELEQRLWEGSGGGEHAPDAGAMLARDARSQQALHYSILKCARDSLPRVALEVLHGDDDVDDVGQVVFANAPRIADNRNELLALDALAEAADYHSLAALYDDQRRESGFAGADAQQVDKQMYFALNCALPLAAVAGGAGVRRTLDERLQLEFPTRTTAKAQREKAPALARLGQHVRICAALGAQRAAEQRGIDDGLPAAKRVACAVRPDDALLRFAVQINVFAAQEARALSSALKQRGKTSDELADTLRRAAALGCDVEDFYFVCQMAYGAANSAALPALGTLQQHWKRAVREEMVTPMLSDVKESRISKRALSKADPLSAAAAAAKSPAGKRKRLDRSALKESADGRVRTIGDMFAQMKRSSSALLQRSTDK